MPCAGNIASHSASERSVFLPGTFFTCWALQSHSSSKSPSNVVDRPPVDPGRLHRHGGHPGLHEKGRELGQSLLGGGEPSWPISTEPVGPATLYRPQRCPGGRPGAHPLPHLFH